MESSTYSTDRIGVENIRHLLITFSVPAIVGMLVSALYNIVDRIFVGQGVGPEGLASIAVTMPILMTNMAFSVIVGVGANALFSIKLGEGRRDMVERIMGNAFLMLFLIPLLVIIPVLLFTEPLLRFIGVTPALMPYAVKYTRILMYGGVFAAMSPGINHFIRSDGHPKTSMFTQLLGAVLNTILDPIFIFVFHWGIEGAAWATVIAQTASFVWVMYYFNSPLTKLRFRIRAMKPDFRLDLSILAIGFAPFAMHMAMNVMNLALNKNLLQYGGDIAVAAMGVVYSVVIVIMMPLQGLNQGAQPIIGFNYGARKYDRVITTYRLAVIYATVFVCTGTAIIELFPDLCVRLFNSESTELMDLGAKALRICSCMVPIIGFQVITSNFFQAVGKPLQSTFLSLSRQFLILIPLIYILPKFFGVMGVYCALPVADFLSAIIASLLMFFEMKSLKRLMKKQQTEISEEQSHS
ncbi:MAG: MATE family efflux transporter [Spirochaetia bacterium]|nr:MATE family efflux transporter [Spirochaetia bacterium]